MHPHKQPSLDAPSSCSFCVSDAQKAFEPTTSRHHVSFSLLIFEWNVIICYSPLTLKSVIMKSARVKNRAEKMFFAKDKLTMVAKEDALKGREEPLEIERAHFVNGHDMKGPYPTSAQVLYFGMGCFWGAERRFWQIDGVWVTAVGYGAGFTPNPTYEEVCTGKTGHNELVMVVFDPELVSLGNILTVFWEAHDPTQGNRQGNDMGTQYRSGIYTTSDEQTELVLASRQKYQSALTAKGLGAITTEIKRLNEFYFAETYHQQYLAKNPGGYCGLKGTDVSYQH